VTDPVEPEAARHRGRDNDVECGRPDRQGLGLPGNDEASDDDQENREELEREDDGENLPRALSGDLTLVQPVTIRGGLDLLAGDKPLKILGEVGSRSVALVGVSGTGGVDRALEVPRNSWVEP
jgi:hypothetical protein